MQMYATLKAMTLKKNVTSKKRSKMYAAISSLFLSRSFFPLRNFSKRMSPSFEVSRALFTKVAQLRE